MGHFRMRVRRAGRQSDLSVPRLRSSRPRAQTRPRRRSCGGAVCDHAGVADRPGRRRRESQAPARPGFRRPHGPVRIDRLQPGEHQGWRAGRGDLRLHGASPGHEPGGAGRRFASRRHGGAVPWRCARARHGIAAVRTHPDRAPAGRSRGSEKRAHAFDERRKSRPIACGGRIPRRRACTFRETDATR